MENHDNQTPIILENLTIPSSDPVGPNYSIKIKRYVMPNDRSSYAVCEGASRPTNEEDTAIVRDLIREWPVTEEDRINRVKHILNIADCLINASSNLAESFLHAWMPEWSKGTRVVRADHASTQNHGHTETCLL